MAGRAQLSKVTPAVITSKPESVSADVVVTHDDKVVQTWSRARS
jgi:hypothetical protein